MFKLIQRLLLLLLLVAVGAGVLQWNNYHKMIECRDNALLYFEENDFEKSIHYLEEGLHHVSFIGSNMKDDMECYLAESYFQLGEYEKAVDLYNGLLRKNSSVKEYYFLKAEAYESMGEMEKALGVCRDGWEETSETVFLSKICDNYIKSKNYEQALIYARKGVEVQGADASEFLFKEIVIYEKAEDYQAAYEAAQEYNQLYPDDEKGQRELKFLSTRI